MHDCGDRDGGGFGLGYSFVADLADAEPPADDDDGERRVRPRYRGLPHFALGSDSDEEEDCDAHEQQPRYQGGASLLAVALAAGEEAVVLAEDDEERDEHQYEHEPLEEDSEGTSLLSASIAKISAAFVQSVWRVLRERGEQSNAGMGAAGPPQRHVWAC